MCWSCHFLLSTTVLSFKVSAGHVTSLPQFIVAELLQQWGTDGFLRHTKQIRKFYKQVPWIIIKSTCLNPLILEERYHAKVHGEASWYPLFMVPPTWWHVLLDWPEPKRHLQHLGSHHGKGHWQGCPPHAWKGIRTRLVEFPIIWFFDIKICSLGNETNCSFLRASFSVATDDMMDKALER